MSTPKNTSLLTFSRTLASLLASGVSIQAGLRSIEAQARDRRFKHVLAGVRTDVEAGRTLSAALSRFPGMFDSLYVNIVRSGESNGKLPEAMGRLAVAIEKDAKIRRRIRSAVRYPVIVLCVALAVSVFLVLFVLPVFRNLFASFKCDLPQPTQFVLDITCWLNRCGVYAAVGVAALLIGLRKLLSTPSGAYARDLFVYHLPVFGELSRMIAAARFARLYAQLVRSGTPILNAIAIASDGTGNSVVSRGLLNAGKSVEKGDPLSVGLSAGNVFPPTFIEMLRSGEQAGRVDDMMDSVADTYDEEVNTMLESLTSLLQPLLIVLFGIIIGGMAICLLLPLFKMPAIIEF